MGELYTRPLQQVVASEGMTPELMHQIRETMGLTSMDRVKEEEFPGMIPNPINRTTGYAESSPRPYSQFLESMEAISEKRLQTEEDIVLFTKS